MSYFKLSVFWLIICVCWLAYSPASAQTLLQNPANINVDNISDAQIKQLMLQAQSSGLTDAQLMQYAESKGMSDDQRQLLQDRIANIRKKDRNNTNNNNPNNNNPNNYSDTLSRNRNYKPDTDSLESFREFKRNRGPKIFGADLFGRSSNIKFEPNLKLATPVNYILGPGDKLGINVYGNSLADWKLDVSPDGNINIPGVGILNVGGKTIEQATAAIKNKLIANRYAIGRGTSLQVGLDNIRSIKVILVGELVRPGTYTLPSLATVFNALYSAGGPSNNGSLRQIEIIRNSKIIRHLDVYDFLTKGSQKDNITLQDQDIVRVPTYKTRVEMSGQVKIPALFEVLPGENLTDIINYAGGFTDSAYTARIKVSQISDQQRKITDVFEADYKNYIPLRGDRYFVQSVLTRFENRVTISGAVFRPGDYELSKGLTVGQLIDKAAGVKEDAFMDRASIVRLKPDNSTEVISFSVRDVANKAVTIPLQREDVITISSIFDLRDKYQITINGSVRKPGTFAYADSMHVEDLIIKAGGFSEGASPKRIEVARRIDNANPESKSSKVAQVFSVDVDNRLKLNSLKFVLKPFDIVSVYSLPGYEKQKTVKVEGEVLYPGSYTIQTKNEKVSDLFARAGGATVSADIGGASLKRENIAILGIDKNKSDTIAIAQERAEQFNRLKKTYNKGKDSTATKDEDVQPRNNYVGIDLPAILKSPNSNIDLLLEDGDVLRIPKKQQVVRVNGEVLYPSAVVYEESKSFKEYVLNAGGFSPGALKRGAYVVYPNGTVKGTRKILFFNSHPRVKPGSEIFVPKKPEPKGNTAQEILGFTTGIASLGAIILGIISLHK